MSTEGTASDNEPEPGLEAPPTATPHGSSPAPGRLQAAHRDAVLAAATAVTARWALRLLLIGAAAVVLWYVIKALWVIVLPVLLGLLLATVLWPPARLLRRVMPPALAALVSILAAVLVLAGLGTWLVPPVIAQGQQLADALTAALQDVQGFLTGPPLNLAEDRVDMFVDRAVNALQGNAQTLAGGVLAGVMTVGSLLLTAVLAVVLCFFFLKDGPRFLPWLCALVGPKPAPHVAEIARRSWHTLSGFIHAQAAVGLVDAVAIGIGLAVLGVPLVLPLAVLIFFGAFIPIVGATVTGGLAALVALVDQGFTTALIVVALVLVVQQVEGNVLQPVLVGGALALHPAVVILAVTAGGTLWGIVGAFLAVPVVAVVTGVLRYARERLEVVPDGPDPGHQSP